MHPRPMALPLLLLTITVGCTSTPKKTPAIKAASADLSCLAADKLMASFNNDQDNVSRYEARVQTGRYTVISALPSLAQTQLLEVIITVSIPHDIHSIGEAARYLLKRSGYQLIPEPIQGDKAAKILAKPLPEIHRKIGPMRLIDALSMLTAPAFELINDPVNREIRYQLKRNALSGELS